MNLRGGGCGEGQAPLLERLHRKGEALEVCKGARGAKGFVRWARRGGPSL